MDNILDFNLLISCGRNLERKAEREIRNFIRKMGDDDPLTVELGFRGLFGIKTSLEIEQIIEQIKKTLEENTWRFRYVLKVTPVDKIVASDIDSIKNAVKELSDQKIGPRDTFRITVRKRDTDLSSHEVIKEAASVIDNKVDLEHPKKVVNIEILGDITAIAIVEEKDIISISKAKRSVL